MQKNTAGQKIGAQMVNASDGSAFTGSVTVSVTGDAGTQATGSVGSGACTHEGNGYHTYAPAQAETNYTLIAFTFTGTGAVPATIQVFTWGFDTTQSTVPISTSGIATSSALATAQADLDDIQTRLPAALVSGRMDSSVGAVATGAITAAGIAADAIGASELAADALAEIADTILQRDASLWEASAAKQSLGAAVMAAVNKIEDSGLGYLIVYRTDGTTEHYRRTITTDPALEPIAAIDEAS